MLDWRLDFQSLERLAPTVGIDFPRIENHSTLPGPFHDDPKQQ
jgi:hypothetical protein